MTPFYRIGHTLSGLITRVFLRARIIGRNHNPPDTSIILACNHASYLDPFIVGCLFRHEIHYLAKQELFRNSIVRAVVTRWNAISIKRGSFDIQAFRRGLRVLRLLRAPLLVFFEGTRYRHGELGTAKTGISFLALKSKRPILPIYISGNEALLKCLIGFKRLTISIGRPIPYSEYAPPAGVDPLKHIADLVKQRVQDLKTRLE